MMASDRPNQGMTDASAFEAFVRRYQDMVFGVAVRLLGDPTEAEDVPQTVFLRAFERFDALADSPTAGGWLKTVATNACLNHLSRFRARWLLFSQAGGTHGDDHPYGDLLASSGSPVADLDRAEKHARLEQAIRRLPPHQRVPLVLYHFQDQSYRDIAARLGVSLGKVKTDIRRGRQALRQLMVTNDASR